MSGARRLTEARREEVRSLYTGAAGGNAVVVQRLLAAQEVTVSIRTIERAVPFRREPMCPPRWLRGVHVRIDPQIDHSKQILASPAAS
jgi:hypothetical protein